MADEEIDDLKRQHKVAGEMLSGYADLAARHGCPPGMSVYAFIAERLSRLADLEKIPQGASGRGGAKVGSDPYEQKLREKDAFTPGRITKLDGDML